MAYDPPQDRLASPTDVGELYAATKDFVVVHGEWTLGNPSQPVPQNPDKVTYRQDQFFGLPGFGAGDIVEIGVYPLASSPPTHHYAITGATALAELHRLVPDAVDVLGVGENGLQIVHHEPFIKHLGGPQLAAEDAIPEPPDSAFILPQPANKELVGRTFRLMPLLGMPGTARGVRSDRHAVHGPLYNPENGLFPDLRQTELDCLVRVVRFAVSHAMSEAQAEPGRAPQREPQEEQ